MGRDHKVEHILDTLIFPNQPNSRTTVKHIQSNPITIISCSTGKSRLRLKLSLGGPIHDKVRLIVADLKILGSDHTAWARLNI